MDQPSLRRDSHVLLLLASHLGSTATEDASNAGGLDVAEWNAFEARVRASPLDSPGDLLALDADEWPADVWTDAVTSEWAERRLGRATKLAMALEDLDNRGVWVTTRYEPTYPGHLRETLGDDGPPFLYVAGAVDNLHSRAVAVLGAGETDDEDRDAARALVTAAVADDFAVVTGGANSFDETVAVTARERGGPVVEFPAEGLYDRLAETRVRKAVMDGELTVATASHPRASPDGTEVPFRSQLLHGGAEYAAVVRLDVPIGGLWDGATENLDRGWSPLLVRHGDDAPAGNRALVDRGGIPIDPVAVPGDVPFEEWVTGRIEAVGGADEAGRGERSSDDSAGTAADARSSSDGAGGEATDEQSSLGEFE